MSILRGIGRFCYDFIVGDDWKIAAAVLTALFAGFGLLAAGTPAPVAAVATGVLIVVAFTAALIIDVRRTRPR